MACITILNLDDDMKTRLRLHAAEHHRSMEEEARMLLRDAVGRKPDSRNLASIVGSHFGPDNGVDLQLPPRAPSRAAPSRVDLWRCRAKRIHELVSRPLTELDIAVVFVDAKFFHEHSRLRPAMRGSHATPSRCHPSA